MSGAHVPQPPSAPGLRTSPAPASPLRTPAPAPGTPPTPQAPTGSILAPQRAPPSPSPLRTAPAPSTPPMPIPALRTTPGGTPASPLRAFPTIPGSPPSAPMSIPARTRRKSLSMTFGGSPSPKRPQLPLGPGDSPPEHPNMLRRLSMLFQPSDGDPASPRSTSHLDSLNLDSVASTEEPEPAFKDRNAIKVKVITWNMADALPKGDLSVLLGEVPPYEHPTRTNEIPELPVEDAHPYHVVVFAAQECPAPSGMPRGLGGSLMKGVGLQKSEAHRREKEDKRAEMEEKRKEEKDAEKAAKTAIKEIRREYIEKQGAAVSLKDLKDPKDNETVVKLTIPEAAKATPGDSSTDSDSKDGKDVKKEAKKAIKQLRREYEERGRSPVAVVEVKDTETKDKPTTITLSVAPADNLQHRMTAPGDISVESDSSAPKNPQANGAVNAAPAAISNAAPASEGNLNAQTDDLASISSSSAPTTSNGHSVPTTTTSNGDCAPVLPTAVGEANGNTKPIPAATPLIGKKPSREQLKVDTLFKRKTDSSRDGAGTPVSTKASLSTFDTGIGAVTDLAGAFPRGPKGWTSMLDEWLCAGPPVARDHSPLSSPPLGSGDLADGQPEYRGGSYLTPSNVPLSSSHHRSTSMSHRRSPSASSTRPINIPGSLSIPSRSTAGSSYGIPSSIPHGRSMLGQSIDTTAGSSLASQDQWTRDLGRSANLYDSPIDDSPMKRWYRQPGAGPYVNVAKERLLGLYLSVFVYKGCEHLVEGVDKDFVTTGLAGGRFGNKGGIGVSLNLKGHRLLFVNAHLAAHAERNDARLANIAKIKSELNLNCFLPADDPRAAMEDITDRFDTTFWCGDLNFRVDISLLHAKWLLEKKQYPEALMFDQLRKAMADPKSNPLPGFEEADITFMPTFKYDVWKSVRATNKEKRKSIRRSRRSSEKTDRPSMERSVSPTGGLDFVPEVEGREESSEGPDSPEQAQISLHCIEPPAMTPVEETPGAFDVSMDAGSLGGHEAGQATSPQGRSRDPTPITASHKSTATFQSERSVSEHANGHANITPNKFPAARALQDPTRRWSKDSREWSQTSRDTPGPSRTATDLADPIVRSGVTLKQKTKKLMGILRLGRKPSARPSPPLRPSLIPDDPSARRTSMSSFRSHPMSEDGRLSVLSEDSEPSPQSPRIIATPAAGLGITGMDQCAAPPSGGLVVPGFEDVHRTTSATSAISAVSAASVNTVRMTSPPRRPRGLIRSMSGHSLNEDADDDDHCILDTRTGVYDTSKKQRVPSWCDRVLWKTHVIPDPVEDPALLPDDDDVSIASSREGPFSRLSNAFSTLSGRMRRRSSFVEPLPDIRTAFPGRPGASMFGSLTASTSVPNALVASPVAEPKSVAPDELNPVFESDPPTPATETPASGSFGSMEQLNEAIRNGPSGPSVSSPPATALPPHIQALSSPVPSRKRGRSVTFDAPAPFAAHRRELPTAVEGEELPMRSTPASQLNALGIGLPTSSLRRASSIESTPSRRQSLVRRLSMSSIGSRDSSGSRTSRRRSDDPTLLVPKVHLHPLKPVRSTGHSTDLGRNRMHRGSDGALTQSMREDKTSLGALTRFFRDLPGRFHSRVSLFHGSEHEAEEPVVERPRRHLEGEVRVLHYGTIDDAGMRQLEGRSDHRPAIFSAAIYI